MNPSYRWSARKCYRDVHKSFTVKLPDKCEWRNEFNPDDKRGLVGYTDGAQEGDIASVLGSTPWYSRLKYMPLRLV
jgi:hypothetical protein